MIKKLLLALLSLPSILLAQLNPTQETYIQMSDGKSLAADIYIPNGCTSCPTILVQTPYNKNRYRNALPLGFLQDLDSSPYNFVIVDWRGFYGSQAAMVQQADRGQDGYDVIEWISNQGWSNGKVGTWGASALGKIQYETAQKKHPNHICAVPQVATPSTTYEEFFYGGALEEARLAQLDALGYNLSNVVYQNPYYNNIWQFIENDSWYPQDITIPMFMQGGWYDHNINHSLIWYEGLRENGDPTNQFNQWFLIGPWTHGGTGVSYMGSEIQGELTYPNATNKTNKMALEFFAYYLLEEQNGWDLSPRMTYYKMGENVWQETNGDNLRLYGSDSLAIEKAFNLTSTQLQNGYSEFVSDPRNPTPTIGGQTLSNEIDQGPYDQSTLDGRSDLVTFVTPALKSNMNISGNVKVKLYLELDQPDADIVVRLVDVYPDGRNMLINDGIKRLRFRKGYTQNDETFMSNGTIDTIVVELPFVNYTFLQNHQVKIYVSGNSSPRWNNNPQNGDEMYIIGDTNVANIKIHHSTSYPSTIILPTNDQVLSVNENTSLTNKSFIYPNPSTEYFSINELDLNQLQKVEVLDLSGKTVKTFTANFEKLSVQSLPNGIYFIKAYLANSIYVDKLEKI